ncbi:hypothetical protein AQUCO_03600065v1 [Aquilegia coerulea]|uniref:Protein NUCLEAR FUSION DEFECTIVE 6, chloroplastic/mitochondrial-like n=1 Tax=Aquilegia coerulea TaxID=218851 RepID=A0A2G5CV49_AQUCA|nr:hypothetical protein AQUCO_03600065v1 [Aquilegia coerulea]PIA35147.1 hypothetical protein AQUCO_03600065v1 [Aquilegia coerulea]PIA35148.1 hypothetical protein AQUCO_03600065v1 [Aquilegia coerulea]
MAIATCCARSFLRSSSFRKAVSSAKATRSSSFSSTFRIPKQNTPTRIFRSPVELSCCLDSLLPFHTATASALLTSMLSVSRPGYGWLPEGKDKTR